MRSFIALLVLALGCAAQPLENKDDSTFGTAVFYPHRVAVVLADTDDKASPLHSLLTEVMSHFSDAPKTIGDATGRVVFVRVTEETAPSRFPAIPGDGLPRVVKYGRKKGKYEPVVYDGELSAAALLKWVEESVEQPTPEQLQRQVERSTLSELTEESFEAMLAHPKRILLLVMVYAPWCGHCKQFSPVYEELAKKIKSDVVYEGRVAVGKLDGTKYPRVMDRLKATAYPTVALVNSRESHMFEGERTEEALLKFIRVKAGIDEEPSDVTVLTEQNFDTVVFGGSASVLVEFYAPWCGHCKRLHPIYEQLGTLMKSRKDEVIIAKVDATKNPGVTRRFNVDGFPTILWFQADGGKKHHFTYNSGRDIESFRSWITQRVKTAGKTYPVATANDGEVIELTPDTLSPVIAGKAGRDMLVMYYAPWCGFCKRLMPDYKQLAKDMAAKGAAVGIARYDAPKHPDLAKGQGVRSFPTIKYYSADGFVTDYPKEFERNLKDLTAFVEGKLSSAQ